MKNSIINYIINNNDSYSIQLENILDNIRFLNEINSDQWDKNIKYRTFREKKLTNLQSKYYLDRGKWVDFILSFQSFQSEDSNIINPFTIEELITGKMRLALFLFWRDIASKLDSKTYFKLQLKLNLIFTTENTDNNTPDQVRSIGIVRVYTKENFNEALSLSISSLYFSIDEYSNSYVKNIILTYSLCF